jgi:hypothetical protein
MSSEDKKKLENSLARNSFYQSRTSNMSEFLEPGEKFTDRLQKLVKDSLKRPGLDIQKITIGKVLKVVKNGIPTPGGARDVANKIAGEQNPTCLQLYIHTSFDSFLSVPNNLLDPGDEETLIYQHYIYEPQDSSLDLQIPNVGDNVYVFHPLAKGYLTRVGVYMGIVGVANVPLESDYAAAQKVFQERVPRKKAIPDDLPRTDECFENPYGPECAWERGRVIGKIKLENLLAPRVNKKARKEVADAYKRMKRAYERDNPGKTLTVNSGFRSFPEQEEVRQKWIKEGDPSKAAKAGFSKHQNGIAIDIKTDAAEPPDKITEIYKWLAANAPSFGFVRTVRSEAWHWVYYGPQQAQKRIPSWQ